MVNTFVPHFGGPEYALDSARDWLSSRWRITLHLHSFQGWTLFSSNMERCRKEFSFPMRGKKQCGVPNFTIGSLLCSKFVSLTAE
ncbi:hypothetical protein IF1G_10025 [Cordyceps javanica]|uniref:Uncharacterized protein n=1 Tax=Cordyceps javanica TaxID=43265 RepID=A0A545UNV4_9HYPO|nr:hypothetical protein IF1G_10025 [Cordyceps javanica]